ncbi:MAG: ribosome biogenesis GTP-binding protein YihA/YsxC [Elusimicrobiota bacterium]|jgi:GTP-binding protein|nr:ribosome biogenesis GTP-binding protein YihA/YsxC [Elusimicrobiota bacterium]
MLEKTQFFRAVNDSLTLPQSNIEAIFTGRSNVGKSSVINALCSQKNLARTSKTPGRTRSINVYSIAMGKWLIDLPGYGFAKVNLKEKNLWQKMIEECILKRQSKKLIYLIIDIFVGPTDLDLDMVFWLKENSVPFKVIANKSDKLNAAAQKEEMRDKLAEIFEIGASNIYIVSAKKKQGFDKLKQDINNYFNGKK